MRPKLQSRLPYICARCQNLRAAAQTRNHATSASASSSSLPPPPPPSGTAHLSNRRLVAVHGPDSSHFLHGITTSNFRAGQTSGFYSAFLNAQGRVLHDVFIYPATHSAAYRDGLPERLKGGGESEGYFVEVDANEVERLWKHMKKFKLRAKVDLRVVEQGEWGVWSVWDGEEPWTPHPGVQQQQQSASVSISAPSSAQDDGGSKSPSSDLVTAVDARAPGMGRRLILPGTASPSSLLPQNSPETALSAYTLRRYLRGVPEGQTEIPREASLPQEYNIDFMGGIDFRKGCYVGQELTIRTHHTGVVRKRILPVMLYRPGAEASPERLQYIQEQDIVGGTSGLSMPGANIMPAGRSGRSAGKWVAGVGNVGLGLCRLEMMTDMVLTAEGSASRYSPDHEFKLVATAGEGKSTEEGDAASNGEPDVGAEVLIKAFVPDWHRSKTKIRKPQVRV